MAKKILITGVSGFAGSYFAEELLTTNNYEIYGTYLSEKSLANIAHITDKIHITKLDLNDKSGVSTLIAKIQPDIVCHLAAFTSPSDSFKNPLEVIQNNIAIQFNILEAIREAKLSNTRVLIVSSAEVYGIVIKEDLPIDEQTPFNPTNPYSVSKIAQDYLALQHVLAYGMDIIRVRPFNHIGPRQTDQFVVASFAKKIAEIEKKKREPILIVGNLEAERDFTDVRDMVKAYVLALEKGKKGEVYNIGSGISYKIETILQKLLSICDNKITIKTDPLLFRPSDTPKLVCNVKKFQTLTDWHPAITIDQSLFDTLQYWRNII